GSQKLPSSWIGRSAFTSYQAFAFGPPPDADDAAAEPALLPALLAAGGAGAGAGCAYAVPATPRTINRGRTRFIVCSSEGCGAARAPSRPSPRSHRRRAEERACPLRRG